MATECPENALGQIEWLKNGYTWITSRNSKKEFAAHCLKLAMLNSLIIRYLTLQNV